MENYELIDNKDEAQYEFHIEKFVPKIEYIKTNNKEIYLTHTEIPIPLEGQGIGTKLVEKTLADVESQGLTLIPLCPFVAKYIHKNPEWKRIVKIGINI